MQKVLIISYFFPPCNLTASQRVYSWAKYLNEFGYYPVVITRRWDNMISTQNDMSVKTSVELIHETYPEYEAYYLPFSPNLKDRIYSRYGNQKYVLFRKILSFIELILQNVCIKIIPYHNLYDYALSYLKVNKDVRKLIVSGNPYVQFKFAYKLQKKTGVRWIADYRDAWSNSQINNINLSRLYNILSSYDKIFEKRWVGKASAITSVSDDLTDKISKLVNTDGYPLYNGYFDEDFQAFRQEAQFNKFTITYVGTLFPGQKIELFLEAFKKFVNAGNNPEVQLIFPGIGFKKNIQLMVSDIMNGYESYYKLTERVDREEVLKTEVRSHLLLYVAWQGYDGIVPSKIYEYIASGTYILVAPSDKGVVEGIVNKSGCGVCLSSQDEIIEFLNEMYRKYLDGIKVVNDTNSDSVKQFSRKLQVEKLAMILDKI